MNKLELIQALKDASKLSRTETAAVVDIFFNEMAAALAKGERVEIRGFCSFFVKEYGSTDMKGACALLSDKYMTATVHTEAKTLVF